ncbi:MAG: carbohydrate binding family 9 domain-containing protein, partial [Acidobacteriota bacterium]|nr:carbohydrate binding family 9 domain-containing protein [Acidobacteriota bacterium]
MKTTLLSALLLCLPAAAAAQTPAAAPPAIVIPRVAAPPQLADYLDGVPPGGEVAVTTFVQREPGDGTPASQQTEAYLSYDDTHLYVIFVARDREPEKIRASLTRREGFSNNDYVGVMLDTFLDRRRAYLFIVNPLGVQLDGVTAERNDDMSFDTVWESEGRLTAFGYVTRMAIPFKSLRFPGADTQQWGIALARNIPRVNETSFWPYITKRIARPEPQMAVATGISGISPGRNMQVIPYAAFTGARFLDPDAPAFVRDNTFRAGVDGKIVVKDALTFDVTLNPDFSQIESDEPQVTINQRFEVFFNEKRPFFIENASYFQTPINLFFSRRIADPLAGLRVTGKARGWSAGGLLIDDRAPGERLEQADPLHPDAGARAGIGVVRVQRDLPRESTIGALATVRDFASSQSRVLAVDTRLKLSDTWVFSAQAAMSELSGQGADETGQAYSLLFDRSGRNWGAFLSYEQISPGFRAPLGFVRRTDTRRLFPFVRYTWFAS